MKRIKFVVWERKLNWEEAQSILSRQTKLLEMKNQGKSESEIEAVCGPEVPDSISGSRSSKNSTTNTPLTRGRWKRKASLKSSWFIV